MPDPIHFRGISYGIQRLESGLFVRINVRYRMRKASYGLPRSECEEIWETCGEMPARLADEIPESVWDQHREAILELVGESLGK
ncbi:hypothetical protein [Chromohalobacter canadensis]|uniref:hypothetical protein n=1 Tax=Chromohalobacter canadensis TaxID=141389 RepID=UPI00240F3FA0|nr:hypothetical protein [Chromohalobacter canadensis]